MPGKTSGLHYYAEVGAKSNPPEATDDRQTEDFHAIVSTLLQRFKLEPGMLAGSAYTDLHLNDVGLLSVLAGGVDWNVRKVASELCAADSTVSSALDRLENRGLVKRQRGPADRRVMLVELTASGRRLALKVKAAQIENCRQMLAQLSAPERKVLIRLAAQIAQP